MGDLNMDSVDREPWVVGTDHRPPALEIVLVKQTIVLSWLQFIYAEGSDDEVRIAFASHDVILRGAGLSSLLHAITANRVTSLREPARADLGSALGFGRTRFTLRFLSRLTRRAYPGQESLDVAWATTICRRFLRG